jgi:hypothetical protein
MVTVDPRTQALIWAAEKAAREVTVTLNLVPPPGIVALKSGKLAAGISSPAKYMPKKTTYLRAGASTVRAEPRNGIIAAHLVIMSLFDQWCIQRNLCGRMEDDLPRLHDPDVGPGLEILSFNGIIHRAILRSYDYYPGPGLLRCYWSFLVLGMDVNGAMRIEVQMPFLGALTSRIPEPDMAATFAVLDTLARLAIESQI